MSRKTIGTLIIIVGIALAVVSLGADFFGFGSGGGIGWKQIVGILVGVLLAAGGGVFLGSAKKTIS